METSKKLKKELKRIEKLLATNSVTETDIVYLIACCSKFLYEYDKLKQKIREFEQWP